MSDEMLRGKDRRKERRYKYGGQVRVWQSETGGFSPGSIVDLSMGGCLIQMQSQSEFEKQSLVEVSFKSDYLAFRTMGSVRRCDKNSNLVGISYVNLGMRGRLDLGELFQDLEAILTADFRMPLKPGIPSSVNGPFLLRP